MTMGINYTKLILGRDVEYEDKFKIHVPKIKEIIENGESEFMMKARPFTDSVRKIFSGMPEIVDEMEKQFPSLLLLAFDEEANNEVGELLTGNKILLSDYIIESLAYWVECDPEDFQLLPASKKIVSEKLNWIIDVEEYEKFADYIKVITLYQENPDLIAPKNVASNDRKLDIWKKVYAGRLQKQQNDNGGEFGDKILILQISTGSFMTADVIENLTYYQFVNMLNGYMEREAHMEELAFYTSSKFDTKNMKLTSWQSKVKLIKNNKN